MERKDSFKPRVERGFVCSVCRGRTLSLGAYFERGLRLEFLRVNLSLRILLGYLKQYLYSDQLPRLGIALSRDFVFGVAELAIQLMRAPADAYV